MTSFHSVSSEAAVLHTVLVAGSLHREGVARARRIRRAAVRTLAQGHDCSAGKGAAGEAPGSRAGGCSPRAQEDIQRAERCTLQADQGQAAADYIHRRSPAGAGGRWRDRPISRPWYRTRSQWHRA